MLVIYVRCYIMQTIASRMCVHKRNADGTCTISRSPATFFEQIVLVEFEYVNRGVTKGYRNTLQVDVLVKWLTGILGLSFAKQQWVVKTVITIVGILY